MQNRRYTSPNENFEYGYPHSNALLQFCRKLKRCKPLKAACDLTVCDRINDVKLFPTLYHSGSVSRALDWESKGRWFVSHHRRSYCVVSLSKTLYSLLSNDST